MNVITEKICITVELASFVPVSAEAKNEIVNRIFLEVHAMGGKRQEFLVGQVNWEKYREEFVDEPLWPESLEIGGAPKKNRPIRATKNLSLGQYIREKRLVIGISQKALGKIIDVSEPCVSNWESGKAIPTHTNLSRIAKALSCPRDQLTKHWRKDRNTRKLLKAAQKDTTNESNQQAQPAADIRERDTAADVQQGQQRDIRHGDSFATANSSITTAIF
jgi:transcriptional regulator with XRE-family HTH domain